MFWIEILLLYFDIDCNVGVFFVWFLLKKESRFLLVFFVDKIEINVEEKFEMILEIWLEIMIDEIIVLVVILFLIIIKKVIIIIVIWVIDDIFFNIDW